MNEEKITIDLYKHQLTLMKELLESRIEMITKDLMMLNTGSSGAEYCEFYIKQMKDLLNSLKWQC
jgi:hypothetical protein